MRLVLLSDTHNQHSKIVVPGGDVLIHAGDATGRGTIPEIAAFNTWLGTLPHKHKIFVAGNHDWLFERDPGLARSLITNATYLQDSEVTIDGVRFYGSPWQPWFQNWAFNRCRGPDLAQMWELIPEGIDVLITHGPPKGILDRPIGQSEDVGCEDLLKRIEIVKPKLNVFGHIHEGYGTMSNEVTTFINASICTANYNPINSPIVIDLER